MEILNLNNLPITYVKQLNEISKQIKDDFHLLVEDIYKETDGGIDWIVNSILSRHNYLSSIFHDLCYIELTKMAIKNENVVEIIVLNLAQKKVLNEYATLKGLKIKIVCSINFYSIGKDLLFPFKTTIFNLISLFKMLSVRSKKRKNKIPKNIEITLIDTFFIPSMFKNGKYYDRYYTGLIDQVPEKEKKYIYFVPTILKNKYKKVIGVCDKADENFLYKFDYLHLKDYFRAFLSPIIIKRINFKNFEFNGLNISPILKYDFRKNISNNGSFQGILNYLFFKRLKQNNIRLRLVINWFENQVSDRGFNKGKNDFYPNVLSIGYQGFHATDDSKFHLQPTTLEYKNKILPQSVAVVGHGLVNHLKEYCPNINVITAPIFRSQAIHQERIHKRLYKKNKIKILIALPNSITDSIKILKFIKAAIIKGFKHKTFFYLKVHPAINIETIKNKLESFQIAIELIEGEFSKIIEEYDLMISAASSTCMEALAFNVPLIIICFEKGFIQNPIPETISKIVWDLCYTSDELIASVNRLCSVSHDLVIKKMLLAQQIRDDFFEPVNKENVYKFLNYKH